MTQLFVIWSIEHNAWWAPNRHGYVRDVIRAGRYAQSEAREIVDAANGRRLEECMIPVECIEPELE
jgi:hypothetical protein